MFRHISVIKRKYGRLKRFFRKAVGIYRREGIVFFVQFLRMKIFLPDLNIVCHRRFKPDRKTILFICGDLSSSAVTKISLMICRGLAERYNVVAVLPGDNAVFDEFEQTGATVLFAPDHVRTERAIHQLCGHFSFAFALVNGLEFRSVLPFLRNHFVPAITLIHEDAVDEGQRNKVREAIFWSDAMVFSGAAILNAAEVSRSPGKDGDVSGVENENHFRMERAIITRWMRPDGASDAGIVVLGAGLTGLYDNVDRFIECAARINKASEGTQFRFIWLDPGYNQELHLAYRAFCLQERMRRAGLSPDQFFVLDNAAVIDTVYENADLLMFMSESEPRPSRAIDAMAHGVPVVCFDANEELCRFMRKFGLDDYVVAAYPDVTDLAQKVLNLAKSPNLRRVAGKNCQYASARFYDSAEYIHQVDEAGKRVCPQAGREAVDAGCIMKSGFFRRDFFECPPSSMDFFSPHPLQPPPLPVGADSELAIGSYIRAWATGIGRRKPFPGFHPGIYQEQHGLLTRGADPLAEYLRAGQPEGPWRYSVICGHDVKSQDLPDHHHVALHLHVYYPELLPEITARLFRNHVCPDLFVSVADDGVGVMVADALKEYKGRLKDIRVVPNRGRDIGPFLTAFGREMIESYDFVGHIHTKKSECAKDSGYGRAWYEFLLENQLGGRAGGMADSILAAMTQDASMGMVFPDDPYAVGWESNKYKAEVLAQRLGLQHLPDHFIFPLGTMFWARSGAVAPLIELNFGWEDFPEEPLSYDGTILHAIERLFALSVSLSGWKIAVTNVAGVTR